jgi:hypothetical protein
MNSDEKRVLANSIMTALVMSATAVIVGWC